MKVTMVKKSKKPKQGTRGPKPEVLKIEGDWREAVKKSLAKKKPPSGWPLLKVHTSNSFF
jgi:hypothetical protein